MDKLFTLHKLLRGLAQDLEKEALKINQVSGSVFLNAINLLDQPAPATQQPDKEDYSVPTQVEPALLLEFNKGILSIGSNIILRFSKTNYKTVKQYPIFFFPFYSSRDANLIYLLDATKSEFQQLLYHEDKQQRFAETDLLSIGEFKFFISLLENTLMAYR